VTRVSHISMRYYLIGKKYRAGNPDFERDCLEARHSTQAEDGVTPKKRKCQQIQVQSELFESDNEDGIAPAATEEPVEESGSE
jgi:hypothetical protein